MSLEKLKTIFLFSFERGRDSVSGGGTEKERERDRQRKRIPRHLCTTSTEPNVGFELTKLWDRDLSQNREADA